MAEPIIISIYAHRYSKVVSERRELSNFSDTFVRSMLKGVIDRVYFDRKGFIVADRTKGRRLAGIIKNN